MGAIRLSLVARLVVAGLGSFLALPGTTSAMAETGRRASPDAVPTTTSFKVAPAPVSARGGKVTATAKARSGLRCTFSTNSGSFVPEAVLAPAA